MGKEIHDNIWGTVKLTDDEVRILDHPLMQRLRRISQLGLVNMVYPSAGHSRLAHSLGVMALAQRVGRSLLKKEDITLEEEKLLRIAALVHDVGHYPLSHSTEEFYTGESGSISTRERQHEERGAFLIMKSSLGDQIDKALKGTGYSRHDAAEIVRGNQTGKYKDAIWQLINSTFDLDRMDYLMRDGMAVGLDYGRIDFSRILSKIVVDNESGNLGLDVKATTAIENYVLARYYLWDVVYYHKGVMGFEIIQIECCKALSKLGIFPTFQKIKEMEEQEFCQFDDSFFWSNLYNGMRKNEHVADLGKMLINRIPLKMILEVPPQFSSDVNQENVIRGQARTYFNDEEVRTMLLEKTGTPKNWYFSKELTLPVYKFIPIIDGDFEETQEKIRRGLAKTIRLFKITSDGKREFAGYLATNPSSIISKLLEFSKTRYRFYTHPKYANALQKYLQAKIFG